MTTDPDDPLHHYDFRNRYPHVRFGTASDRYAGWVGQIYSDAVAAKAAPRQKVVGGTAFRESVLPADSVAEYFDHFDVLEIDHTFYTPLLAHDGTPTRTFHTLQAQADAAPEHARFLLKAPEEFVAPGLRRGGRFTHNPAYLDAEAYQQRFLLPARDLLGARLQGIIAEQGYLRKADSPRPRAFLAGLDRFFDPVAALGVVHHLEIRSPHLLGRALADWAAAAGVGIVLSHWTWLPPLRQQWDLAGARPAAADGSIVLRLLTPLRMNYAEAYTLAHPFNQRVEALANAVSAPEMVQDTLDITRQAARGGWTAWVIANNRAWGNAPKLLQTLAMRLGPPAPRP